jgi:D-alanine-D-alanine ligase
LRDDDVPYVLEVNTLPGMTPTSDLPQAAAADGIDFPQLVEAMLKTAYKEVEP